MRRGPLSKGTPDALAPTAEGRGEEGDPGGREHSAAALTAAASPVALRGRAPEARLPGPPRASVVVGSAGCRDGSPHPDGKFEKPNFLKVVFIFFLFSKGLKKSETLSSQILAKLQLLLQLTQQLHDKVPQIIKTYCTENYKFIAKYIALLLTEIKSAFLSEKCSSEIEVP